MSLSLVNGNVLEVTGKSYDRRVGRVHLGVDRRRRQAAPQQIVGGIDRGLNFLLGDIEHQVQGLNCNVTTKAPAELADVMW